MAAENFAAARSSASSQLARRPQISGTSRRRSVPSVSPSAEPFEQRRPALAGCAGSPFTSARGTPSPLVGEGRGGGSCRCCTAVPPGTTPTPDPSPQGGGEKGGG